MQQFEAPNIPKRGKVNFADSSKLVSNIFSLKIGNNFEQNYIYDIKYDPDLPTDSRKLADLIITKIDKQLEENVGKYVKRGKNLFAQKDVENTTYQTEVNDTKYTVQIKKVGKVDLQKHNLLPGVGMATTQVINSKVKRLMKQMGLLEIGKNAKFFDPSKKIDLKVNQTGLTVLQGYKTSASINNNECYLLIDFASRVLRSETALQVFKQAKSDSAAEEELIDSSVMAIYSHTIYKVTGINYDLTPESTFTMSDGSKCSYKEYFQKKYKANIKDMKQPLLESYNRITGQTVNLVPELMQMTGITDEQKNDYKIMQRLAEYTKMYPRDRQEYIEEFCHKFSKISQQQGININSQPEMLDGWIVDPPRLEIGKKQIVKINNGNFNLKDLVYEPCTFNDWLLVYNSQNKRDDDEADNFVDALQSAGKSLGYRVEDPGFLTINNRNPKEWINKIDSDIQKNGKPLIVVTLVFNKDKNYKELKEYFYKRVGVPAQNVTLKALQKNKMSVCSKILMQMAAKLGKQVWYIPKPADIGDRTMIIGMDKYIKLVKGKQACLGFVSTLNPNFSKFYSQVLLATQDKLREQISNLIAKSINEYYKFNGKKFFPERIIIYRDGVGDSQLQQMQQEINHILNAFKDINEKFNPELAIITVNKKIGLKFFSQSGNDRKGGRGKQEDHGLSNPLSGTIIADTKCTQGFQFTMAAQKVNQGTCNPTQYTVVYNSTKLNEETFWQLTYSQTYNYYNWTGAVKVPGPVQYAKKIKLPYW